MHLRQFKALLFRHGVVQSEIDAEQSAPRPDPFRLLKLKRLRLSLKDRMHRLASELATHREFGEAPVRAARRRPFDSNDGHLGGAS
jgi:hypothetical protein